MSVTITSENEGRLDIMKGDIYTWIVTVDPSFDMTDVGCYCSVKETRKSENEIIYLQGSVNAQVITFTLDSSSTIIGTVHDAKEYIGEYLFYKPGVVTSRGPAKGFVVEIFIPITRIPV